MKLVTGTIDCQRMCLSEHVDSEIEKLKRSGLEVIGVVERKAEKRKKKKKCQT